MSPCLVSLSVQASVGKLEMCGVSHGDSPTVMITSNVGRASGEEGEHSLVDLQLEINPLDRPGMDVTVSAVLRPLQITYDFVSVPGVSVVG